MQNVKYGVGPRIDSWQNQVCIFITRISILIFERYSKIRLKELIFGHVTEIRQRYWLISVKMKDLWVFLDPIERFDLYAD